MSNWKVSKEQISNVLRTIWFRLTTTNDAGNSVELDGRINLNLDNLDIFLPYEQITKTNRLSWIKNHAGDFYENTNSERLSQI